MTWHSFQYLLGFFRLLQIICRQRHLNAGQTSWFVEKTDNISHRMGLLLTMIWPLCVSWLLKKGIHVLGTRVWKLEISATEKMKGYFQTCYCATPTTWDWSWQLQTYSVQEGWEARAISWWSSCKVTLQKSISYQNYYLDILLDMPVN